MPRRRAQLTDEDWQALLNSVAAEVLALQKAGRDVLEVCAGEQSGDGATVKDHLQRANASGATEQISLQLDDPKVKLAVCVHLTPLTRRFSQLTCYRS